MMFDEMDCRAVLTAFQPAGFSGSDVTSGSTFHNEEAVCEQALMHHSREVGIRHLCQRVRLQAGAGHSLEELDLDLQAMTRLRFFVPLRALGMRAVLLVGGSRFMSCRRSMRRTDGHGELVSA
jgi:hypothetical protein